MSASHLILSRCSFVTDAARIVIDTSQPTIIPPTVVEDAAQSNRAGETLREAGTAAPMRCQGRPTTVVAQRVADCDSPG